MHETCKIKIQRKGIVLRKVKDKILENGRKKKNNSLEEGDDFLMEWQLC